MLPHRMLIVCSLVALAAACARPLPPTSPAETAAESRRPRAIFESFGASSDRLSQELWALVLFAALQLNRARNQADGSYEHELARASLQRALTIDDGYLPALNQLAVYYLELARAHAAEGDLARGASVSLSTPTSQPRRLSRRHLELASLAVERALERDAGYAPAHNTEGVICVELGNYAAAARAFARARQLDPDFFEAHMNYAALNLRFRGFVEAELAYRAALVLEPKDYEAHIGLALALRMQLAGKNQTRLAPEIMRTLAAAAKVAPGRPEVVYNRALFALARARILLNAEAVRLIEQARADFEHFVDKAGAEPRYAREVVKAREYVDDLRDTGPFLPEPP